MFPNVALNWSQLVIFVGVSSSPAEATPRKAAVLVPTPAMGDPAVNSSM